eukprot:CAMPEP_0113910008 /NCGR_PEP_ID=MMETSP0780_2-20120614/27236_1 /TAXON_ID=652834 /ORGANISM="Palpitomonas bilix" /LENGTH=930 /DNA_ID=CAMNT_0000906015 /DNA_START=87 /DNA_END=2879 /DNA_ORIENTATION=+ /assembly_acc=CAM_ASM_000599
MATTVRQGFASMLVLLSLLAAAVAEDTVGQDTGGSIFVSTTMLIDSPVSDMRWLATIDEDGAVAADKTVLVLSQGGILYRSVDEGKTWTAQTDKLKGDGSSEPNVAELIVSPANDQYIFLRGSNRESWYSKDGGDTFVAVTGYQFRQVKAHPRDMNLLVASQRTKGCDATGSSCFNEMYLSQDFGTTWKKIAEYVFDFEWGLATNCFPREVLFVTISKDQQGDQDFRYWSTGVDLVMTLDFFASNPRTVLEHTNKFVFQKNYLYAASVSNQNGIELHVSTDCGNSFVQTRFPYDLSTNAYNFLSSNDDSVFIHVDHALPGGKDYKRGNVYASDFTGASFTEVLPNNVRGSNGLADFHPVEGLDGVIIANVIDQQDLGKARQRVQTKISYDNGGKWSFLPKPLNEDACSDCSLHLHGVADRWPPMYSSKNAIGLIVATGNVGHHVHDNDDEVNTYFSRDGGLTWSKINDGKYIYDMGDHGGVVVAALQGQATHSLVYSWSEGQDWTDVKFKTHDIEVDNIITEPGSTSSVFIVYGRQGETGVLVQIDFRPLHERQCDGANAAGAESSDYEEYVPTGGEEGKECLLGRKMTYVRRKQTAKCFNGQKFERRKSVESCYCEYSDFECDYGYEPSSGTNGELLCTKISGDKAPAADHIFAGGNPEVCTSYYYVPNGFRKVPGDGCVGGLVLAPTLLPCGPSAGMIFLIILLVLLGVSGVGLLFYFGQKRGWCTRARSTFSGISGGGEERGPSTSAYDNAFQDSSLKETVIGFALKIVDGVKGIMPKKSEAAYSRLDGKEGDLGGRGDFTLADEEEADATEVKPAQLRQPSSTSSPHSFGPTDKMEVKLSISPAKREARVSGGDSQRSRNLVFDEDEEEEEVEGRQQMPAMRVSPAQSSLPRGDLLDEFPIQKSDEEKRREKVVDSLSDLLNQSGP